MRVAKVWNKLPDQFIHAASTNAFKNRLDKYWESEEIYYSNHRAEISGGRRSDIQYEFICFNHITPDSSMGYCW
jgi:hypothetical protein